MRKIFSTLLLLTLASFCVVAQQLPEKRPVSLSLKLLDSSESASETVSAPEDFISINPDDKANKSAPRNVYPGIDYACFINASSIEYVFRVSTGADPSLIRMIIDGWNPNPEPNSSALNAQLNGIQIRQSPPTVFLRDKEGKRNIDAVYDISNDKAVSIKTGAELVNGSDKLNSSRMNKVPAGGQPGGPSYDFYMSKNEITHSQFLRFLNDAEVNPSSMRGSNMHFDEDGNVWINPEKMKGRDEMFNIFESKLEYDKSKPVGMRYSNLTENNLSPFANHPIEGMSWFGSVKYCNWLTIQSGRNEAEICYREGTNVLDWAPITCTNWANGQFSDLERALFLKKKGFRLPMLNSSVNNITTNKFNEFYKASAWSKTGNKLYGDGTSSFPAGELLADKGTVPVGSMDGKTIIGGQVMPRNRNLYGINDLSGNSAEWTTDLATGASGLKMAQCGGAYFNNVLPLNVGKAVRPSYCAGGSGARASTTYMPEETLYIHIIISFFRLASLAPQVPEDEGFGISGAEETEKATGGKGAKNNTGQPEATSISLSQENTGESRTQPTGVIYNNPPRAEAGNESGRGGGSGEGGGEGREQEAPVRPGDRGGGGAVITIETLTVNAINRVGGIDTPSAIPMSLAPTDIHTNSNGTTPFSRQYQSITTINLTAPLNDGILLFKHWLRNGSHDSSNRTANVLMNISNDMIAVYVPARTLNVSSFNPAAGADITVSLTDANGNGSETTSGGAFTRTYPDDTGVALTAAPTAGGNNFRYWLRNGVFDTTNRTTSILMNGNFNMVAEYLEPPRNLDIRSTPSAGIGMTVSAPDINGNQNANTDYVLTYTNGASVNVTAPQLAGTRVFTRWELDAGLLTTNLTASVNNMVANHILSAVYVDSQILSVQSTPDTLLAITVDTSDIYGNNNGPTAFTRTYTNNPTVSLTAPAMSGTKIFYKWLKDGAETTTNLATSVLMDANHTMVATYTEPRTLSVQSSPAMVIAMTVSASDLSGQTDGNTAFTRIYTNGQSVAVTAPSMSGTRAFTSWLQDGAALTTNLTATVAMNANHTLTANYVDTYVLNIQSAPNPGAIITVSKSDIAGNTDGTTSFTRTYTNGSAVSLTAPFNFGTQIFQKWTQDGSDLTTNLTANLTVGANHTLVATYVNSAVLTIDSTPASGIAVTVDRADIYGNGNGNTTIARTYTNAPAVNVTAPFTSGTRVFEKWVLDGTDLTTNLTANVTMNANHSLTASYTASSTLTVQSTPASGLALTVSKSDIYGNGNGSTLFTRTYTNSPSVDITAPYAFGTTVFDQWILDGAFLTTNLTASVSMAADHTLVASYAATAILSIQSLGAANVPITISKNDINGNGNDNTAFSRTYTNSPTVDATAPYIAGNMVFTRWTFDGAYLTTNLTASVIVNANHTLVAEYTDSRQLILQSTPITAVGLTVDKSDIYGSSNGSTAYSLSYTNGSSVNITAPLRPISSMIFSKWTEGGLDLTTNLTVNVAMGADHTLVAVYVVADWNLDIQSSPDAGVNMIVDTTDKNGDKNGATSFLRVYTNGTTVQVTTPALNGTKYFDRWRMDGITLTTNLTANVLMEGDHTLIAHYTDSRELRIVSSPLNGVGITVDALDLFGNGNGTTAFSRFYTNNAVVNITAPALSGSYLFIKWIIDLTTIDTNLTTAVNMNLGAGHTVAAFYVEPAILTVDSTPGTGIPITLDTLDVYDNKDGFTHFTRLYTNGTTVAMTAPATSGTRIFQGWLKDGALETTNLTAILLLNASYTMTAQYTEPRHLTVQSTPANGVTMTPDKADMNGLQNGNTTFTRTYTNGTSVNITAPYIYGSRVFEKWAEGGSDLTTNLTVSVAMNANHTITASYVDTKILTVQSINPASGVAITVSKPDINGNANATTLFSRQYTNNSLVDITAPYRSGFKVFEKWTEGGSDVTTNLTTSVTMSADHTLVAVYVDAMTLTVEATDNGIPIIVGTTDINGNKNDNTTFSRTYTNSPNVDLTAPRIAGTKIFVKWTEGAADITTNLTTTVAMGADHTLRANYIDFKTLIVQATEPSIAITVDTADIDGLTDDTTQFDRSYTNSPTVNITAPYIVGTKVFAKWTEGGSDVTTNLTSAVNMSADHTLVANYVDSFNLRVESVNPASGIAITVDTIDVNGLQNDSTTFDRQYTNAPTVSITAPYIVGTKVFAKWTEGGSDVTTNLTTAVNMSADHTLVANYVDSYNLRVQSVNPASGIAITVDTIDVNGLQNDSTTFDRQYTNAPTVNITAPYIVGTKVFQKWTEGGSDVTTNLTTAVNMSTDHTLVANYIDSFNLNVQSDNPVSGVAITVDTIDINGRQNDSTTFDRQYTNAPIVTLTAPTNHLTLTFEKWSDGTITTTNPVFQVTMDNNRNVVATYVQLHTLTVQSEPANLPMTISPSDFYGAGDGSTTASLPDLTRRYLEGSTINITAPPNDGVSLVFNRWVRDTVTTDTNRTITINNIAADTTIKAYYTNEIPPLLLDLVFNPTSMTTNDSSVLTATASGGSGTYVDYTYWFKMGWYEPADPNPWTTQTTYNGRPVNTYTGDYTITYRAYVTDSFGATSQWAYATVTVTDSPTNEPPASKNVY